MFQPKPFFQENLKVKGFRELILNFNLLLILIFFRISYKIRRLSTTENIF